MKLVIQIPCYNEEMTIADVLSELPDVIPGISSIETVVIDDGSTDNTIARARANGVDYVIKNIGNKGLGNTFRIGVDFALRIGADILVNTDGDNQYPGSYIEPLVLPILEGHSDIVVGNRQTDSISHFSVTKKFFQRLGTLLTRLLSGGDLVEDAVSGFRAYSRAALIELNVTSEFSYVLDTTLQASNKKIKTSSVPIVTNAPTRPSRLFSSIWEHMWKSGKQLLRVFAMYRPLRVFISLGIFFGVIGSVPLLRFVIDYFYGSGGLGKIQSLVIGGVLISVSLNMFALGVIGDMMSKNRNLIEQVLSKTKAREIESEDKSMYE